MSIRILSILLIFCLPIFTGCSHKDEEGHHNEAEHSHSEHDHNHEHDHDHGHAHNHNHNDAHNHDSNHSETEGHEHPGAFILESEIAAKYGIVSRKMEAASFSEIVKASGRIESALTERQTVTAKRSGIFTPSTGISQGVAVKRGETIGIISAKGMEGGDVNAAAIVNAKTAKKEFERISSLYKQGLATNAEYNAAERAYHEAEALIGVSSDKGTSSLSAPCDGTILQLPVSPGEYVEAGTPVAIVAGNSLLTLRADLPRRYASSAERLISANFKPEYSETVYSISELGGKRLTGSSEALAENGYIPVYFTFNSRGVVQPGSFAEVYLLGDKREGVISLPKDALLEIQGNKYAYVVHDGHAYEKRLVTTGATDGVNFEIISGIVPGETVVTKGAGVVRMAETSAIAPPAHNHEH